MATEIPVKVTADTRQAERDIKRFEDTLRDLDEVAGLAAKALGAITAAAGAMTFAVIKTLDAAGELVDVSKALGISAANLQQLHSAAMMAGVSGEALNQTLIKMSATLGDALTKGSGPAVEALDRMGISVQQINTLRPDQQFKAITDSLLQMTNPAERNALAYELLGKQGPRLLEVAKNLKEIEKVLTDADFEALDAAGESIDKLKVSFDVALKQAVAALAPYIIAIVELIRESAFQGRNFGEIIINSVIPAIKLATQAAVILASMFVAAKLAAGIIVAVNAMIGMYQAIKVATGAAGVLNAVLGKNPIIKILGAVTAIAGAAVALGKVDSAFDELDAKAKKVLEDINKRVEQQKNTTEGVVEATKRLNEAQKKVLDEVNKTILGYERSARAQSDKLKFGETESIVQQRISEITEKLKAMNPELVAAMRDRVRAATEEEEIAKRIFDTRKTILDLEKQAQVARGANSELLTMQDTIKKATENRVLAERGSNQELLNEAIQQEAALKALYKDRVMVIAQGASERGKIEQDYYTKTNELEFLRQELIRTGVSTESQLFRDLNAEKLRLQEDYVRKSEELQLKSIEKSLMAQQGAAAQALSDGDQALLQKKGAEERQSAIVRERIEFEKKSEMEKAQFAIQQGASVFSALGAQNKRAFEAAKAFNIANAIMNTYAGATKALATYPWPFGLIAAAAAVAAGLAQVAQIRSQTYSGRALGGPVMGGTPYMVGESGPELFVPGNTGSIVRNGDLGGGTPVIVNFQITANDTTGFDQLLASRKGVIQQIISDAMLEKGRRSMV